ncbi:MAG: type II secretion system F family protein [Opitutales bacterium]
MSVSHKTLSNWYLQMAQHLEAGTPLAEALSRTHGPPAKDRLRLATQIKAGRPVENVLQDAPRWLPRADRPAICAAMESSRLPQTLRNLSDQHAHVGATQLKVVFSLIYPLGVFHFAVLVAPVVGMIDFETGFAWDTDLYLRQTAALIVPVWVAAGLVGFLVKAENPLLPRILRCIPLLCRYSKAQAMANFCYALGTLLDAGVPIRRAWRTSAEIARDPGIARAHRHLDRVLAAGEDPAQHLDGHKCFPPDFVAFYQSGAHTGNLEQNLLHAGGHFQSRANNAMTLAAIVYPTLLFICVAGLIIITIFRVYGGYLDMIDGFLQM